MVEIVKLETLAALQYPLALWVFDLLERLMEKPPGVLSVVSCRRDGVLDPWWFEERASWDSRDACPPRRVLAELDAGCFRAAMALVAVQLMNSQFWGGESLRVLQHQGRRRGCALVMSNKPASGYWLRVYLDLIPALVS